MTRLKLLKNYDEYKKGDVFSLEDAEAQKFIKAGIAVQVPDPTALENMGEIIAAGVAKGLSPLLSAPRGDSHPANVRIDPGESEDDKTKGFADFVKCVVQAGCPTVCPGKQAEGSERLEKVYKSHYNAWEKKDLAEGSGTTGGYTVAPTYARELLKLAGEQSIVRPFANVKNLPAREAYYPMLNQTFTPTGGASAYYGGVSMVWTGEAQPRTATEPNFKQVHVVVNELAGLCKISRTLLSDTMIAMEAELRSLFAGAIAYAEDVAFLNGDGVAKPLGIRNAAATITYPTRVAANKFKLDDAANMMGALLPESQPRSLWVMTHNLFPQLVTLVDASGRVTYVPNVGTGYGDAKLAMGRLLLFGRPVVFTEKLPALGTVGDVLLADFSKYIVADTGGLEIAASDQYAFNTNQITFRVIQRVDGQPQLDAPFTQQDGTSQLSPFVLLDADAA